MLRIGSFPIKKKLTWMNMLVSGAALLIASGAFLGYERTMLRLAMGRNLSLQAQIAGRNCASALLFNDSESAESTLSALNAAPNILSADIYGPSGQPFARFRRGNYRTSQHEPQSAPKFPAGGQEIQEFSPTSVFVARPIIFQEKLVGSIVLVSDREEETERLKSYAEIITGVLAISLLAAWLLSSVFQGRIAEPIMELALIARTVSVKKQYSLRAPSSANKDEVGVLVDAFNEMLSNIQDRDAAIQDAHERLNLALRSSGTGTWNWSAGGSAMVWDDYMYPLFGLRPNNSPRQLADMLLLIDPSDRMRVQDAVHEFAGQGRTDTKFTDTEFTDIEFRTAWPDGSIHWLTVRGTVFRGPDGEAVRMAGVCWDISGRKRIEEDRRKFVSLIEQSADLIAIAGADGGLVYLNPAGHALAGSAGDALGSPAGSIGLADLCVEPWRDRIAEIVSSVLAGTGNWVGEVQLQHTPDARVVDVLLNLFAVNDPETGNFLCLAAVARDITERRKLERQLREAQKLETLGQLAGGVAHDFGTLLTVISGFAQLISAEFPAGHNAREAADEIYSAANRATVLTRQLLAFGRRQNTLERDIAINGLVRSVDKMLRPLMAGSTGADSDLVLDLDETAGFLRADRGQLEQVIVNLVINARDSMPAGGKVRIETARMYLDTQFAKRHGAPGPGEYVRLSVSDTGTGMTPEVQQRLFEPFFTTKEPGKGTGLGLTMVNSIVNQSRAFISVKTELGKGSDFQLYFPAVHPELESEEFEPEPPSESYRGDETVLVLVGDAGYRRYLCDMLERQGYRALPAADLADALDRVRDGTGEFDMVIADSDLAGYSETATLAAVCPNARILVLAEETPTGPNADRNWLRKPFPATALISRTRHTLDLSGEAISVGKP